MGPKAREKLIRPLQQRVKDQGLWACHLGPELGGQGFGQVMLGLMNEKLGRNSLAPTIFGCQAPDTGNAEIIAHYGTEAQKDQWLKPLLNGDIRSAYSMSEPSGGSDPLTFRTSAVLEGDEWVINGEKWFSTNAKWSTILIVYAVTDPDAKDPYRRMSMFIVPTKTPGVNILQQRRAWAPTTARKATSNMRTSGCRRTPCSAPAARPSSSARPGSAAVGCITPCERSGPAPMRSI